MKSNNTSGVKRVYSNKKANQWHAQIAIDGIVINLGNYDIIKDATQARVQRVNQVIGQYKNACESINFENS